VIVLIGIPSALYKEARGFLGCDPPPPVQHVDPNLAETESAITAAHLMMTSGKPARIDAGGMDRGSRQAADHLAPGVRNDEWTSLHLRRLEKPDPMHPAAQRLHVPILRPDGRQSGDDIVRSFPARD
jgi:hypothetical protein